VAVEWITLFISKTCHHYNITEIMLEMAYNTLDLSRSSFYLLLFFRQELKYVEDGMKKRQEEYKTIYDKEKDRATKAEVKLILIDNLSSILVLYNCCLI
jgi:hypothetical protein